MLRVLDLTSVATFLGPVVEVSLRVRMVREAPLRLLIRKTRQLRGPLLQVLDGGPRTISQLLRWIGSSARTNAT